MPSTPVINTAGPVGYAAFTPEGKCAIMAIRKERAEEVAKDRRLPVLPLFVPAGIEPLLEALRFYARQQHYYLDPAGEKFEDVSGEPPNWLCAENCGSMLEDGTVADHALHAWEANTGEAAAASRAFTFHPKDLDTLADISHTHANALQALQAIAPEDQQYRRWAKRFEAFRDLYTRLHRAADQVTAQQHTDDAAVDAFAAAMKAKLAAAREKGRSGWDDPTACTIESLALQLRKHVNKGDPVDVANFAMMIHQRGGSTRFPPLDPGLLEAIRNAPASAHAVEHGGQVVFINRGTSDADMLAMANIPHGELQAKVVSIKYLAGEIRLQMRDGAEVPQDLESAMVVDLLYTPAAAAGDSQ